MAELILEMDFRIKLFLAVLAVILLVSALVMLINRKAPSYRPGVSTEADQSVNQAQVVYQQKKNLGTDFSKGPCLSDDLLPDWVLDLVHNPRQEIDNKPENQCRAYLEGRAHHFVELDLYGNVVRVN